LPKPKPPPVAAGCGARGRHTVHTGQAPLGAAYFVAASEKDFQAPRRSDMVAVRKDYTAPTALGRIGLKFPIKFSTRFGNGRILRAVGILYWVGLHLSYPLK